jgi:hypothetical protein
VRRASQTSARDSVEASSRLLRPWHPALDVSPLTAQQVADAGDIAYELLALMLLGR